jgi:hypothetical protein
VLKHKKQKSKRFFKFFALKNTKLFGAKTQTFVQTPTKKQKTIKLRLRRSHIVNNDKVNNNTVD